MSKVKQTERGWGGHFVGGNSCHFRRNTLLEYESVKIVVSTVGLLPVPWEVIEKATTPRFIQIGSGRYYETMVFQSDKEDKKYHDADVSKEISFTSIGAIGKVDADDEANDMHDEVVLEIVSRMFCGDLREGFIE